MCWVCELPDGHPDRTWAKAALEHYGEEGLAVLKAAGMPPVVYMGRRSPPKPTIKVGDRRTHHV